MSLDELIDLYIPEIAAAFRQAIDDIVDKIVLSDVTRAIELGDPIAAFKALGFSEAALRPMTLKLEQAFESGGVYVGSTFPKRIYTNAGPTVYRFDVRNARAEKWIKNQATALVTLISDETKESIKNDLYEGLKDGKNPREISLDFVGRYDKKQGKRMGGKIGLNEPQKQHVKNMRKDLENLNENYFTREKRDKRFDSTVRQMFENGKVDEKKIKQLTTRYNDNLLKLRGDTIARDAALEALNASEWEALKQADDLGAIKAKNTKRFWDSSGNDGRTRHTHLAMDNHAPVGLNEPFVFPNNVKVMYPQDRSLPNNTKDLAKETINCRCKSRTEIDWIKDLQEWEIENGS